MLITFRTAPHQGGAPVEVEANDVLAVAEGFIAFRRPGGTRAESPIATLRLRGGRLVTVADPSRDVALRVGLARTGQPGKWRPIYRL